MAVRIEIDYGVLRVETLGDKFQLVAHTGSTIEGDFVPNGSVVAEGDDVLITRDFVTVNSGPSHDRKYVSFKTGGVHNPSLLRRLINRL